MEVKPDGKEVNTIWPREKLIPDATIKWSSVLCSGSFYRLFPVKCLNDFRNQINFVIIGFPRAYDD